MSSPREVVDRVGGRFALPDDPFGRLARRRDRKRRNQRIGAGALALVIVLAAAAAFARAVLLDGIPADQTRPTLSTTEPTQPVSINGNAVPGVSIDGDAFVDIRTGEVTPLPNSITSTRDPQGYAVAPDGAVLLFEARPDASSEMQLFVVNVDGTNLRQLTDAPGGAIDGSWSPDGTMIVALLGWSGDGSLSQDDVDLVLIDAATGDTTVLTSGRQTRDPRFSADGRLVLVDSAETYGEIIGIPVDGGAPIPVITRVERPGATFSPDGQRIAWQGSITLSTLSGPSVWLADADGSHPRRLIDDEAFSGDPSWSPDGARIVYTRYFYDGHYHLPEPLGPVVMVVDVAGGGPMYSVLTPSGPGGVGSGGVGVWLDDDTLIVDVGASS